MKWVQYSKTHSTSTSIFKLKIRRWHHDDMWRDQYSEAFFINYYPHSAVNMTPAKLKWRLCLDGRVPLWNERPTSTAIYLSPLYVNGHLSVSAVCQRPSIRLRCTSTAIYPSPLYVNGHLSVFAVRQRPSIRLRCKRIGQNHRLRVNTTPKMFNCFCNKLTNDLLKYICSRYSDLFNTWILPR